MVSELPQPWCAAVRSCLLTIRVPALADDEGELNLASNSLQALLLLPHVAFSDGEPHFQANIDSIPAMAQALQRQSILEKCNVLIGDQNVTRLSLQALVASDNKNSACKESAALLLPGASDASRLFSGNQRTQNPADEAIIDAFLALLEEPQHPCQERTLDSLSKLTADEVSTSLLMQRGSLSAKQATIAAMQRKTTKADEVDSGETALHLSKAHGFDGAYTLAVAAASRAPRLSTSQEVCDLLYNGQQTVPFADENDKEKIQSNGIFAAIQRAHYDGLNEMNLPFQENILFCNTLPFHAVITLFTEAYLMIASDILVSTTCLFVADGMRLAKMFNSIYSCHERKGGISEVLHSRHSKFSHQSLIHMKPRWKMKTSKLEDSIYHFLIDPG